MKRVVALGDSITFGQHIDREHCWTTHLAELLGVEVVNRGVCADTTRLALERFSRDVAPFEPDVLLLQFGHNDCNRWDSDHGVPRVSLAAFRANLAEMLQRARALGIADCWLLLPHPTNRDRKYESDRARYAAAMHNIYPPRAVPPWLTAGDLLDGLHPNEGGHRRYATRLAAALA